MRPPLQTPLVWSALVLLLAGCVSGSSGTSYRKDPDHLGWDELHELQSFDAYYVVQRLRPHWLNARRAGSVMVSPRTVGEGQIQIYVDGVHQEGSPELLKSFPVQDIEEMEHLNAQDATTRYGTGHSAGAILIQTKGDKDLKW